MKTEKKICCICGDEFYGFGNNPWPVKENGSCCNECNSLYVIPARLRMMRERKKEIA